MLWQYFVKSHANKAIIHSFSKKCLLETGHKFIIGKVAQHFLKHIIRIRIIIVIEYHITRIFKACSVLPMYYLWNSFLLHSNS